MATILEFRVTERDGDRKDVPAKGGLGEIIIFPGVRIERHGPPEQSMPVTGGEPPAPARTKSQA